MSSPRAPNARTRSTPSCAAAPPSSTARTPTAPGLVADLVRNLGVAVGGSRLLILGAGGAVRGVLAPLLEQEPREIRLANRTPERAHQLRREFSDLGEISASSFDTVDDSPWDIVINATAASLAGEVPALPPDAVGPDTVCYDMAYGRGDTAVHALGAATRLDAFVQGLGHAGRAGRRIVPALARRAARNQGRHAGARTPVNQRGRIPFQRGRNPLPSRGGRVARAGKGLRPL